MATTKRPRSDDARPAGPPVPAGILDGNGRTARLARWLRETPRRKQVDTLALELKSEDGWARVQSWDRTDVGMHLALPIDAHVTDLANELGAYVTCRLSWLESATGATWTEHALRCQPEGIAQGQAFGGDAQSVAVQTQRALDRLVGAFMGGIETSTRLSERAAEIATSNYEGAQAELSLLRERVVTLEREKAEVEMQLEEALSAAERLSAESQQGAQQSQVTGLITQLIASQAAPKAS
jgi:hypothetical protein